MISVPAYWFFGNPSFDAYAQNKRENFNQFELPYLSYEDSLEEAGLLGQIDHLSQGFVEVLTDMPPTRGNQVELLIDGKAAFDSIYEGIRAAEDYVIIQFFTIEADDVGAELSRLLVEKAKSGVECYVLYDAMGSKLEEPYLKPLREAGVAICDFNGFAGLTKLYRLNFRNHRKLVITDGNFAWIGGMNIKEDYLLWRDTMVRFEGPVVQSFQKSFLEDWVWCSEELIEQLNWEPQAARSVAGSAHVASVPSGPLGDFNSYAYVTLDAINRAEERIWIASPYFVPEENMLQALMAASLRGVDVRILIPEEVDTKIAELARLAAWSYIRELESVGVQIFRFISPFMHQKIILADDDFVLIGSGNFDNRSYKINFELMAAVSDKTFNQEVTAMLEADMEKSKLIAYEEIQGKSYWDRLLIRAARLTAPLL
jgi:cardiolipin synthase